MATTLCLVSRQTHRKVSRMTTTVIVERIDIIEGPNLEGLLKPWLMKEAIEEAGKSLVVSDIHLSSTRSATCGTNGPPTRSWE